MPNKKHHQFSRLSPWRPPPAERARERYQLPRCPFAAAVTARIGLHFSLFFSVRLCQATADGWWDEGVCVFLLLRAAQTTDGEMFLCVAGRRLKWINSRNASGSPWDADSFLNHLLRSQDERTNRGLIIVIRQTACSCSDPTSPVCLLVHLVLLERRVLEGGR